jgi:UDP-N-acetylglucosamine 4,6-dehydratase
MKKHPQTSLNFSESILAITGGTGSFGSTMVRYALDMGVPEIRVFSRDETKQEAMRHAISDSRVRYFLGDVRDAESVDKCIKGAHVVFHAAALKQVPSGEFFPLEAVQTNILGSANVLRSALERQVASVVCLSTDKAVYPINAMGMSKALMEKTAMAFARDNEGSSTRICVTRYGNVMYSRGSVIPLFVTQLRSNKPVTVTDPKMTRFLMSLQSSVELVRFALESGNNGDLLVKKAPGAKVETLLSALQDFFPGSKSELVTLGIRHGEKMFESLLSAEEMSRAEDLGSFYKVSLDTRGLDYGPFVSEGSDVLQHRQAYTSDSTEQLTKSGVKELLMTLPEIRELLSYEN